MKAPVMIPVIVAKDCGHCVHYDAVPTGRPYRCAVNNERGFQAHRMWLGMLCRDFFSDGSRRIEK
jgi:muramoyltetrapeptide carboxypeptidase LdcA involved in peptidoglycan recycling